MAFVSRPPATFYYRTPSPPMNGWRDRGERGGEIEALTREHQPAGTEETQEQRKKIRASDDRQAADRPHEEAEEKQGPLRECFTFLLRATRVVLVIHLVRLEQRMAGDGSCK